MSVEPQQLENVYENGSNFGFDWAQSCLFGGLQLRLAEVASHLESSQMKHCTQNHPKKATSSVLTRVSNEAKKTFISFPIF